MSFDKTLLKKVRRDVDNIEVNYDLTKEPSGFVNSNDIEVSYDNIARTITLYGDLRCLYHGEIVQELLENEISPNVYSWTSEPHAENAVQSLFLKCNGDGFEWTTTPWSFFEVQIAYLIYNANVGLFALREVHGLMPWQSHEHAHRNFGTTRLSGGDLSNFTLNSITATNRRPNLSACTVLDEDLKTVISAFIYGVDVGENKYSHLYLTGASTIVLGNDQDELSFLSGGHPTYNLWDGTEWLREQLPNARFMSVWVLAIPTTSDEFSKKYRFIMVQGQSFSTSLAAERTQTPLSLNLSGLTGVLPEFTFINQIILERTAIGSGSWAIADTVSLTGNRSFFVGQQGSFLTSVTADQVVYNNETSLLTATEVQSAIDELTQRIITLETAT